MQKLFWTLVVGVLTVKCGVCAGIGAAQPRQQDEAFEQLVNVYYHQPDVEKVIAAIPYVVKMAEKKPSVVMPMSGFYFGVVSKSLNRRDVWEKVQKGLKPDGWQRSSIRHLTVRNFSISLTMIRRR